MTNIDQKGAEEKSISSDDDMTKAERKQLRRQDKQRARETEIRDQKRKRIRIWGVAVAVVGVIIFGAIRLGGRNGGDESVNPTLTLAVREDDWIKGNKEAAVELIEYGDFQCPACAQFQPVVKQIGEELGDKIKIVYRHFPLSSHNHARAAAEAAEAAGKQGKFWEMHDLLYVRQGEWVGLKSVEEVFIGYAEELGLDVDKYKEQMQNDEVVDRVQAHYDSGMKSGVNSTPTFFLNGEKMEGYATLDDFKSIIVEAAK